MADGDIPQDLHLQHFSLLRELAEVYLLLDNLSGSASKDLGAEADDAPKLGPVAAAPADGSAAPPPPGDWIETVCKIAWPPTNDPQDEAGDIADLIRARDYLNRKASPANGGTIAFTLLVGDGDKAGHAEPTARAVGWWGREPLSRVGLAKLAFPGLQVRARRFAPPAKR